MLNLLQIADLDIHYNDQQDKALVELSDVIRSLSKTITEQNDSYVQRYISLQTFGNDGGESTSEVRRGNAAASLLQAYRDINIRNAISNASGLDLIVPESMIGIVKDSVRYNFGFIGNKVVFGVGPRGKDLYHTSLSGTYANPNAVILDSSFQPQSHAYIVGTNYSDVLLFPDGTTTTQRRYVWFWFNDVVDHDSEGYYVPTNVLIYDYGVPGVRPTASFYRTRAAYTQSALFIDNLIEAMRVCAEEYPLTVYAKPQAPQKLVYLFDADSTSYLTNSSFIVDWSSRHSMIPLPQYQDCILNTPVGRKAISLMDMPGMIVDWIRNNS